mmetsp:Transcript_1033/g.2693  ORF Transcript_1033/g.2693 Transcript_1033/m.2693 type:complete len:273 (+) Transcript_1033:516-1334(+)
MRARLGPHLSDELALGVADHLLGVGRQQPGAVEAVRLHEYLEHARHHHRGALAFGRAATVAAHGAAARRAPPAARQRPEGVAALAGRAEHAHLQRQRVLLRVPYHVSSRPVPNLDVHRARHRRRALLVHVGLHVLPRDVQQRVLRARRRRRRDAAGDGVADQGERRRVGAEEARVLFALQALVDVDQAAPVERVAALEHLVPRPLRERRHVKVVLQLGPAVRVGGDRKAARLEPWLEPIARRHALDHLDLHHVSQDVEHPPLHLGRMALRKD